MLALAVAAGAFGLLLLSSAPLFSPGGSHEPRVEDLPLHSVTVAPFAVTDDPSLAPAAHRLLNAAMMRAAAD